MNWQAMEAMAEWAGVIGVILSVLYLARELRQHTKASRLAAIQSATENSARISELLASDEGLNKLFWQGLQDPENLNPDELRRFISTMNVFFRRESATFYLYNEGIMPETFWAARVAALSSTLHQPGTKLFLEAAGDTLPVEFRDFMLKILSNESRLSGVLKNILEQGTDT